MLIRTTERGAEGLSAGRRVAFLEGRALEDDVRGRHIWVALSDHGLDDGEDDETVELALAATREEVRGLGIGVALTERALHWAHEHGFRTCVTDWRATSLLSSRFWPRRGFRPTAYRLVRFVRP